MQIEVHQNPSTLIQGALVINVHVGSTTTLKTLGVYTPGESSEGGAQNANENILGEQCKQQNQSLSMFSH